MADDRPDFSFSLSPEQFLDHYWLRSELAKFCRLAQIQASGSKQELTARIAARLAGRPSPVTAKSARKGTMPESFSPKTVIGPGGRCSQPLRRFIEDHLGRKVQFDGELRALIYDGEGQTLGAVIDKWQRSDRSTQKEIAGQFEYNRFVRSYRHANPGAVHAEVVDAWHKHRATPKSQRGIPAE